ncbi:hypothetical protein ACET3Z_030542 [Daucus carota]
MFVAFHLWRELKSYGVLSIEDDVFSFTVLYDTFRGRLDHNAVLLPSYSCTSGVHICGSSRLKLNKFCFHLAREPARLVNTVWKDLDPFEIGQHSYYSPNLLIFDHDALLVPGASGTLLIDMAGRVTGMQITQLSVKEHAYCVRDADRQRRTNDYIGVDQMGRQIKEYTFVECNLKQTVTVQSVQATVKNLFQDEGVDPNTNLNNYLRESVVKYLMKGARQGHATKPSVLPQAPSAEKRPRTS